MLSVEVFMMGTSTWVGGCSSGSLGPMVAAVAGQGLADACS
jgi:hypothetical protein